MNSPQPWYNAERVSQPGSVVLARWNAERQAQRAIVNGPVYPSSSGTSGSQLYEWMTGGNVAASGHAVTERTAMSVSAVYACVGLIGGAIAGMPMPIYQRTPTGRERVDHDLWWLLNEQPCDAMTAAVMWEYIIWSLLLHGDAFALLLRNGAKIVGIEPLHPLAVSVTVEPDNRRRRLYTFTTVDGTTTKQQEDILHIPGLGFDGKRGMSPLRYAAKQAIGVALAADDYSARFFANGARPDYLINIKGRMDKDQQALFRESWMARYAGTRNAHIPAILTGDADVKNLTLPPGDAQLIETRQFQAQDIARIYGVPPHLIGITDKSTSWGSGIEQQGIGFVKYTLGRHIVKIEQEINRKFWPRRERYFAEFNTAGLERGDYKARNEGYRIAIGRAGEPGWLTVNEVRKFENQPPIDGGDTLNPGNAPAATQQSAGGAA